MGAIVPKNATTTFRIWARAAEKDYAPSLHRSRAARPAVHSLWGNPPKPPKVLDSVMGP
jgi:hypothetical protein